MREKLKYRRRLRNSASYILEKEMRSKRRGSVARAHPKRRAKAA